MALKATPRIIFLGTYNPGSQRHYAQSDPDDHHNCHWSDLPVVVVVVVVVENKLDILPG